MRSRTLALAGATALLVPSVLAMVGSAGTAAASAATPRCTIVGTAGANHLVGTSGADVICGLGGNDTIDGRGGSDIIRGGDGSDTLTGSGGNDTLAGGSGSDHLAGGAGADDLTGGGGNDVETGGTAGDDLQGGTGNDDLTGGAGADDIDGGDGTNWCTVGATDTALRCVYDEVPPAVDAVTVSTRQVDVTDADREVTVRVHATDDTGVDTVGIGPADTDVETFPSMNPQLQSGDVRDGWWEGTLHFDQWSAPGTYHLVVHLEDRVSRHTTVEMADPSIDVTDQSPDVDQPSVTLLTPQPTDTYDVRTSEQPVTVKTRITDAVSGAEDAEACIHEPLYDGAEMYFSCSTMRLRSGDRYDGVWSTSIPVLRNEVGGDWNVEVLVTDRAHRSGKRLRYWGPDEYQFKQSDPASDRPFPDGLGRFTVLGSKRGDDTVAPDVSSASASPDHVDTLPGPANVQVTVHADDAPGGGVTGANVELLPASTDDTSPDDPDASLDLTDGTPLDGTWTGTVHIPQGTPPQTYYLKVLVWDAASHWHTYVSSGYPGGEYQPLNTNPTVTIDDTSPATP